VADAKGAAGRGAEGVGLLRSEFVFLGRTTAPSEDEQADVYSQCAKALRPGQPLVIRTLDVGGDKPLPHPLVPYRQDPKRVLPCRQQSDVWRASWVLTCDR